jgi:hypothetical protein
MMFLDPTELDTPKAVVPLRTSDQPDAEPSIHQYTTLIRDISVPTPPSGFEPTILEGERPLTHASDPAVTGIGDVTVLNNITKGFRAMSPSHLKITVNKDS